MFSNLSGNSQGNVFSFSTPCYYIAYQAAFKALLRSSIESWFPFGKTIIQEWVLLYALFVPSLKTVGLARRPFNFPCVPYDVGNFRKGR